ncbi:hypothetical protein LguiB_005094 [Lonicera macranthoides]
MNSDCEQYRKKLIKNEDEHETFFIKVGSPGSAYASPTIRPPFVCACFVLAQRQSIWMIIQATNLSLFLSIISLILFISIELRLQIFQQNK